jgi:hypothetical protein
VYGLCPTTEATASDAVGVRGRHAGSGVGVYGESVDGTAVRGASENSTGVWGSTSAEAALAGFFSGGAGVKIVGNTTDGARLRLQGGLDQVQERQGSVEFQDVWGIEQARLECRNTILGHILALVVGGQDRIRMFELGSIEILPDPTGVFAVDGTARVDVLEIEGADVAEKFPVSEAVAPGMVVAIDPERPGQLCLARGAYNRCVAGVVSGAGDVPTGAILGHMPGHEDAPPIALNGRVWVFCDAGSNPIRPGDLLVTSETPGHAMKAVDLSRSQGATLGKAMSRLARGERGLVLVLVSLQ